MQSDKTIVIEYLERILKRDKNILDSLKNIEPEYNQNAVSIDEMTAEIPENIQKLPQKEIAEQLSGLLELYRKKENLLSRLLGKLKEINGI